MHIGRQDGSKSKTETLYIPPPFQQWQRKDNHWKYKSRICDFQYPNPNRKFIPWQLSHVDINARIGKAYKIICLQNSDKVKDSDCKWRNHSTLQWLWTSSYGGANPASSEKMTSTISANGSKLLQQDWAARGWENGLIASQTWRKSFTSEGLFLTG
jgi:hypothetical protein